MNVVDFMNEISGHMIQNMAVLTQMDPSSENNTLYEGKKHQYTQARFRSAPARIVQSDPEIGFGLSTKQVRHVAQWLTMEKSGKIKVYTSTDFSAQK